MEKEITIPIRCTGREQMTAVAEKLQAAADKLNEANALLGEVALAGVTLKLEIGTEQ